MCTNCFVTPATELATTDGFSIKFLSSETTVRWMRDSVSDGVCAGTAASVAALVAVRPLHEAWMLGTEGLGRSIVLLGLWSTVVWDAVASCSGSGLVMVLDFFFGETCRLLVEEELLLDVLELLLDTWDWLLMLLVFLLLLLGDVSRLLLSGSALLSTTLQSLFMSRVESSGVVEAFGSGFPSNTLFVLEVEGASCVFS